MLKKTAQMLLSLMLVATLLVGMSPAALAAPAAYDDAPAGQGDSLPTDAEAEAPQTPPADPGAPGEEPPADGGESTPPEDEGDDPASPGDSEEPPADSSTPPDESAPPADPGTPEAPAETALAAEGEAEPAADGPFAGGSGTEQAPYQIATAAQLATLAEQVNSGTGYAGVFFELTEDLDLSGHIENGGWVPIGEANYPFRGTFDGGGHTISGLYINRDANRQGLFGHVSAGGAIKNVVLEDCDITGRNTVGGIAGSIGSSISLGTTATIQNCVVSGKVTGTTNSTSGTGGIVGDAANFVIENCAVYGAVSGASTIGGILGSKAGASTVYVIKNCVVAASVSASLYRVGGVHGYSDTDTNIEACLVTGPVSGKEEAGGIMGIVNTGNYTIKKCVVLSSSVTAQASVRSRRILGYAAGTAYSLTNNHAWKGTLVNGSEATSDIGTSQVNGANATAAQIATKAFWQSTVGLDPTVWTLADGKLPVLTALAAMTPQDDTLPPYINTPFEGEGTAASPYKIATAEQLATLASLVNNAEFASLFSRKYYTLTQDIDLSAYAAGEGWVPIGKTGSTEFRGTFDGNNHTITGLVIGRPDADWQGLFGLCNGATIKNLFVSGCSVTGRQGVGGIVGWGTSATTVENCAVSGTVRGTYTATGDQSGGAGGVVGRLSEQSEITNCFSSAAVSSAGNNVGGIAGFIATGSGASLTKCLTTGAVKGRAYVGGLVGGVTSFQTNQLPISITGNVVLAPTVEGQTNTGRVIGYLSGLRIVLLNHAWAGTLLNGASATGNLNTTNGASATQLNLLTTAFWSSTVGLSDTVWTLAAGKLPVLASLPGQTDALPAGIQPFAGGSGTQQAPYQIATAEQLATLAALVNDAAANADWAGKHYLLTENIDLSGYPATTGGGWVPIGKSGASFTGVFDGGGKTISGLAIERAAQDQGLFGYVKGATLRDFALEGCAVAGGGYTGALAGDMGGGTLSNVRASGQVSGTAYVGGLVGDVFITSDSTLIEDCTFTGGVTATSSGEALAGGLVGYLEANDSGRTITVQNCSVSATVTATGSGDVYAGGVAGHINVIYGGSVTVQGCAVAGSMSSTRSGGSGDAVAGGVAGLVRTGGSSSSTAVVQNCAAAARVTSGGVVGLLDAGAGSATVQNCLATGNAAIGGVVWLVNAVTGATATVQNCAALGKSVSGARVAIGTGSGTRTLQNNHAWEGMLVNGKLPTAGIGHDNVQGASLTAASAQSAAWWQNTLGLDPALWLLEDGKLPTLRALAGQTSTLPAHIKAPFEGDGTPQAPYQIATAEQLATLAALVNDADTSADWAGKHYLLTENISLSGYAEGEGWVPIGKSGASFTGVFDGGGKTISGLAIKRVAQYQGLFGYVKGATLRDFALEGCAVAGGMYTGALAGYMGGGTLSNVRASGQVSGTGEVGGLVGSIHSISGALIEDCAFTGEVTATYGGETFAGGLVGYLEANDSGRTITVQNCSVSATVTATGSGDVYAGGVAGRIDANSGGSVTVQGCAVAGSMSSTKSGGSGDVFAGGVAGLVRTAGSPSSTAVVQNCAVAARVTANGNSGGMVGQLDAGAGSATVQNCLATGNAATGGVVWLVNADTGATATVQNCAALGKSVVGARVAIGTGSGTRTLQNNHAWEGMLVNGKLPTAGIGHDNMQGASLTAASAQSAAWWQNTLGLDPEVWRLEDGKLPTLRALAGQNSALPVYIKAPFEGEGNQQAPYQIATAEQLATLATLVNDTETTSLFSSQHYLLVADIGLSAYAAGEGWVPIGNHDTIFTGVFDGGGKTISGLAINRPNAQNQGLFGMVEGVTLRNMVLEGCAVAGVSQTGALAGNMGGGTLSNVRASGQVSSGDNAGGLVGYLRFSSRNTLSVLIENCAFTGGVTATRKGATHAGGLVGNLVANRATNTITVQNCDVSATVAAIVVDNQLAKSYAGGVVGRINASSGGGVTVQGCAVAGTVSGTETDGGNAYTGGVAGQVVTGGSPASAAMVQNCAVAARVTANQYAGGVVGQVDASAGSITVQNCLTTGDASGKCAGGVAGEVNTGAGATAAVKNCAALGQSAGTARVAGGLAGDGAITLQNNHAWAGMLANGAVPDAADTGPETRHGADISADQAASALFWGAHGLGLDNTVWRLADHKLPVLRALTGQNSNLPAHIKGELPTQPIPASSVKLARSRMLLATTDEIPLTGTVKDGDGLVVKVLASTARGDLKQVYTTGLLQAMPGLKMAADGKSFTITGLRAAPNQRGTLWLRVASLNDDDNYAECRIDVDTTAPAPVEDSVRLVAASATVYTKRTGPQGKIQLQRVLTGAAGNTAHYPLVDNGAVSISFSADEPGELFKFTAIEEDVLGVQLLKADEKAYRKSYKGTLVITTTEGGGVTLMKQSITLKIDKKYPTLKATAVTFNTWYTDLTLPLTITGGTVEGALEWNTAHKTHQKKQAYYEGLAGFGTGVDGEQTITKTTAGKLNATTLYLLAKVDGWAGKVPLTLKVSAKETKPALKLKSASVKMYALATQTDALPLQVLPKSAKIKWASLSVKSLTLRGDADVMATFDADLRFDPATGGFALKAKKDLEKAKYTLYLDAGVAGSTQTIPLKLTVTRVAAGSKVGLNAGKTTVTLNPALAGGERATVQLAPSVAGYKLDYGKLSFALYKGGKMVCDYANGEVPTGDMPLAPSVTAGGALTIAVPEGEGGSTYKLRLSYAGMYVGKEGPQPAIRDITVKTLARNKAAVTATARVTGSVNLTTGAPAVVTAAFKNYLGEYASPNDAVRIYRVEKDKTRTEVTGQFAIDCDGANQWRIAPAYSAPVTPGSYKLVLSGQTPGGMVTTKEANLKVMFTKPKVTQSVKSGTLYRTDPQHEIIVRLTMPAGTPPVQAVRLSEAQAASYTVENLRGGYYAIRFKNPAAGYDALPKKGTTLALNIYLEGNASPAATAKVQVTVK